MLVTRVVNVVECVLVVVCVSSLCVCVKWARNGWVRAAARLTVHFLALAWFSLTARFCSFWGSLEFDLGYKFVSLDSLEALRL